MYAGVILVTASKKLTKASFVAQSQEYADVIFIMV